MFSPYWPTLVPWSIFCPAAPGYASNIGLDAKAVLNHTTGMPNSIYVVDRFRDLASKAIRKFGSEGFSGVSSSLVGKVSRRLRLDEAHVWYQLLLDEDRPHMELPPEVVLKKAGMGDLEVFATLPAMLTLPEAEKRLRDGNDLWLASQGRQGVFACWILHGEYPVVASPRGFVTPGPGMVAVEDSITSPSYRGKSVAPAVICQVAESLRESGEHILLTKVAVDNTPSRRFVGKVGFEEIGTVRFRKRPLHRVTSVEAGNGSSSRWLAEQLTL